MSRIEAKPSTRRPRPRRGMVVGMQATTRNAPARARSGRGQRATPLVSLTLLDGFAVRHDGTEVRLGAAERRLVETREGMVLYTFPVLRGVIAATAASYGISRISPASLMGTTLRVAPTCSQSSCQGTMFE